MNQQKIIQTIKMVLAVAVLTIGTTYALAVDWTAPPVQPPGCPGTTPGCNVPINTSVMNQVKLGGLGIGGFFSAKEKVVIGHGTAAPTLVDSLKLRIFGKVGAEAYCDQNGNNCIIPPGGGGTATSSGSNFWQVDSVDSKAIKNTNNGKVNIAGKIRVSGGNPAENKVLVAQDATGLARWRYVSEILPETTFVAHCDAGEAIQSINADGNPTCVNISTRGTSGGSGFLLSLLPSIVINNITNSSDSDGGSTCRVKEMGSNNTVQNYCSPTNRGQCIATGNQGLCIRRLCC